MDAEASFDANSPLYGADIQSLLDRGGSYEDRIHVGEKRHFESSRDVIEDNQKVFSTPAGNGAALLLNFAYQPRKKKLVDQ